jgi:tetratricopeptide (TPR) repeat protein
MAALSIRYRRRSACLQQASIILASLVPGCMAGSHAEAQILTTQDLQKETAVYEAASRRAEPPQMPPLQAGQIWSHLGTLYQDAGKYGQAQPAYEHAMRFLTLSPTYQPELAATIDNEGTLYMQTGNLKEAEEAELKALHLREAAALESQLPISWYHLANLFLRERHPAKSEEFARRAVEGFSRDPNAVPEDKIGSLLVLAASACQTHRYPEAIAQLQTALGLSTKTYGADRYPTGLNLFLLGYAYWKSGDAAAARPFMEGGYAILGREIGWHPVFLIFMKQYAHLLRDQHERQEARVIEQELKEKRSQFSADPVFHSSLETIDVAVLF